MSSQEVMVQVARTQFEVVWSGFLELSSQEQGRFIDAAKQLIRTVASQLRSGARVEWRNSKTGAMIQGEFIRMKTKFAEVRSFQDRDGRTNSIAGFWNVPPEMLRLVPPTDKPLELP